MGINSLLQQDMQGSGLAGIDRLASNAMYPQSQQVNTQFATPSQMPTSAEVVNAGYEPKVNAYTGMPVQNFAEGGIARLAAGGSAEERQATIADLYKKLLGRDPSEGEDIMQWNDYLGEGSPSEILSLANRLAQTEEGAAYGKSEGNKVFSNMVELTQKNSPFAGTENPYSNMKFLGEEKDAEGNPLYRFQDQNSGLMTVDANGQPIKYEPGAGWYDEQLRNRQDALRAMDYRNQTYLASDPLEQTYNFQGVNVPIEATEYQVDPTTGQFVKGATGENVPLRFRDPDYNMWNDWAAPVALLALPAAGYAASAYGVGAAGAGAGAGGSIGGIGVGGAFVPTAGSGASFLVPGAAAAAGGAGAAGGLDAYMASAGLNPGTFSGSGFALPSTTAAGSGAFGLSPELAAELGLEGATSGLSTSGAQGSAALEAMGLNAGSSGITAKQAYAAKMGLDMLNAGAGGQQTAGYAAPQTFSAPATMPTVNRFGVTGYEGQVPTAEVSQRPILLSKIKGIGGDYTFAEGGIATLGSYSDGGQLLKGPGDGMSDNIPAKIGEAQPARLADGEFVIPADVVSHLGNGSTDAGAKQLYSMMDKIRKARTGNKKQGKQINPSKFLP
jgi:hypothetical protein